MKKIFLGIYFMIILIFCAFYLLIDKKKESIQVFEQDKIVVDLKGAVNNPGVKEVTYGTTVNQLINLGGGLLESADTSNINLSRKVNDEDVVIIYTKDELQNNDYEIKVIDKECICPALSNSACIESNFINIVATGKISLNTATKEELMTLSNIGSAKADAIIKYRENNIFYSIEDVKNVKGIGQALFEKIKDYITI